MNNFKIIYRILSYLEKAMDYDEADIEQISAQKFGISEQRWIAIMKMLNTEGYMEGITVKRSLDGEILLTIVSPQITLKGLEYLQENAMMRKAANIAKGIADIIP